jgi:hypothetical protein
LKFNKHVNRWPLIAIEAPDNVVMPMCSVRGDVAGVDFQEVIGANPLGPGLRNCYAQKLPCQLWEREQLLVAGIAGKSHACSLSAAFKWFFGDAQKTVTNRPGGGVRQRTDLFAQEV